MSDEDLIDESLYLIANPMKKKKTYVYENYEQDIQILLQKKYKKYNIDDDTMEELFQVINEKLEEIKIKKIVHKMISQIFENILSEYP
jgi:transcriptional regulator NrdR family protein